ncbi:ferric reductase-like transmembrane domain-containing protein [Helicobacter sp. 16-1353]|uniref:ferric reductase-like transmembrane domain-containing protein n=1 Tax=Helicobacter sp. 16-1353 TaxID=2004996 RepID=UPI0015EF4D6C|nr:ferric reductase-like transmembrane domain-containing protein [Helicobacter sp. 16-1353]
MLVRKIIAYIVLFVLPLLFIFYGVFSGFFGVEFSTEVLHYLGRLSIFLLTLMLLSKYLSRIPFLSFIQNYKKEIGISSFLFAFLHILLYIVGISPSEVLLEIFKRRYILLGFLLFALMLCMFIFSFCNKSLFFKCASLILPFSLLGSLHYLFSSKVVYINAMVIFFIILILLCVDILESKKIKKVEK